MAHTRHHRQRQSADNPAQTTPQMPPPPATGEQPDTLTPADERALDKAWSTVTDKQMADSIAFTERMQRLRKQQQQKGSK